MGRDYNTFIDDIGSENTAKIARSMSVIGEYDYADVDPVMIDEVVLSMRPKSPKDITTSLYVMSLYAKHIGNDDMEYMIRGADRNLIWEKAKPMAPKKFISKDEFDYVCSEIIKRSDNNSEYYVALFSAVYNGIYSDDLSVLKNLRSSDVHGNAVDMTYSNGEKHTIEVPDELSERLVHLGDVHHWWRNNRYGSYKISTSGEYKDSCFKVEKRNGTDEYTYRYSYYRALRKVANEYIGRKITPLQLYVSGIMYRISLGLAEHGISLSDAFSDDNRSKEVASVVGMELDKTGYDIEIRNFREIVKGHIDVFSDNT